MAFLYKLKQNFQKIGGVVIAKFFLQMGSFWANFRGFDLVVLGKFFLYKKEGFKNPPILLCFKAYPNADFGFAYAGALSKFPFFIRPLLGGFLAGTLPYLA